MPTGTVLVYALLGGLVPFLISPVVLGFQRSGRAGFTTRPSVLDRSVPAVIATVGTGSIVAAVCVWRMPAPVQAVSAYLCVLLVLTSVVDIRVGRLPNLLVVPSFVVVAALLVLAWRADPGSGSLLRAAVQTGAVLVFFTVSALMLPRSFGMGDARLLALIAAVLGYLSVSGVVVMMVCLAALASAVLGWRLYRGTQRSLICLGPLVAVATVVVLWLSPLPTGRPAVAGPAPTGNTLVAASDPVPPAGNADERGQR